MKNLYRLEIIKNKKVYIAEKHHYMLLPWAQLRRELAEPPILLTFDNHTDTRIAFTGYLSCKYQDCQNPIKLMHNESIKLLEKLNFTDDKSVNEAILILRNDEHIDTAIKSGIISKALVIQYSQGDDKPYPIELDNYRSLNHSKFLKKLAHFISQKNGTENITSDDKEDLVEPHRPYKYYESEDNIYIIGHDCYPSCKKMPHNDECKKFLHKQAIETKFIRYKFEIFNQMCPKLSINNILMDNYILDIDLDYFHNKKSIHPNNPMEFYKLIKNSYIITIALEQEYFKEPGYEFNCNPVDYILEEILKHVERAMQE